MLQKIRALKTGLKGGGGNFGWLTVHSRAVRGWRCVRKIDGAADAAVLVLTVGVRARSSFTDGAGAGMRLRLPDGSDHTGELLVEVGVGTHISRSCNRTIRHLCGRLSTTATLVTS